MDMIYNIIMNQYEHGKNINHHEDGKIMNHHEHTKNMNYHTYGNICRFTKKK